MPTLHVAFNMSAAGDLRRALSLVKSEDSVVALQDDLSFGPINPSDAALRAAWIEAELGYSDWHEVPASSEEFWAVVLADGIKRVAWMSRRSAHDYAGFLEFLWRLDDRSCDVVDLTETKVSYRDEHGRLSQPNRVVSAGLLSAYQIVENKLYDLAQPLTPQARMTYRAMWQKLRTENAALRIVGADLELTSAPISYFDAVLLSHVRDHWLKVARVVGETMVKLSEDDTLHIGDIVLTARVRALAAAGLVEAKGDLTRIRFSEIRLPSGPAPVLAGAN